jgi:hypothetical protein
MDTDNKSTDKEKGDCRSRILRLCALTLIFLLVLPLIAQAANAQPTLYRHHIVMIQGDDPKTEAVEPESQILVIERFGYLIPFNETFVAAPVPKEARAWSIDQVEWSDTIGYYPGEYSAIMNPNNPPFRYFDSMVDMDCCVSSDYYWGFPQGTDRNLSVYSNLDTDTDFIEFFDDIASDKVWNFSSDGLSLKNGNASGDYISSLNTANGITITTAEMSWSIDSYEENATFAISNNNGTDWIDVTQKRGEVVNFSAQGTDLIWKINMTQDPSINNTPVLSNLWINTTFIDWNTEVILQLSYILDKDMDSRKFEFVLDLYDDYINFINPHVVVYINKDHEIISDSLPMVFFETQTEYPDKDAYVFMSGGYDTAVPITINENEKEGEEARFSMLFLLIILLFITGIIVIMILGKREGAVIPESEESEDSEEMEGLRYKKEGLLLAIKKLDSDYKEGLIDEDTYSDLRASYKAKAVDVAKELDALAIAAAQPPVPEISAEEEALIVKKEKLLKSIKKLDSDYEEGLLDDDVYQELRTGYKGKAVETARELDELRKQ